MAKRDVLHSESGAMASLAEMSYRRNDGLRTVEQEDGTLIEQADGQRTIITHIDTIDRYEAYNPLDAPGLVEARETYLAERHNPLNGQPAGPETFTNADYIEAEYGLTVDPVDRGDGLTHVYTDNGFSAFITVREDDPNTAADETAVVVTFRGTDMADDGQGSMMRYVGDTGSAIAFSGASKDGFVDTIENPNWLRQGDKDILGVGDQDYIGYSRESVPMFDKDGMPIPGASDIGHNQFVDPGDWYSNAMLGFGTYSETQYDDAKAFIEFVQDHVAEGRPIAVNGQSLGGGLAGNVGAEYGLETNTFGMAPFKHQLEVISERNAIRDMIDGPYETQAGTFSRSRTVDYSDDFGDLKERVDGMTHVERNTFERDFAKDINELTIKENGALYHHNREAYRNFNEKWGTDIDSETVRAFTAAADHREDQYNEFTQSEAFTASTVAYEFTTNSTDEHMGFIARHTRGGSWMGFAIERGSDAMVNDRNMHIVKLGRDMTEYSETSGFTGESLVRHSPAFNDLMVNSQSRDITSYTYNMRDGYQGGQFSEVFRVNEQFKFATFHKGGVLGGVTRGKEGPNDDNSASRSEVATAETVYRALSISERGDDALYNYTTDFFLQPQYALGRITEGGRAEDPNELVLSNGVTQIGMQVLRDEVSGLSYDTLPGGEAAYFAGDYRETGYVELDLTKIDSTHDANYIQDESKPDTVAFQAQEGFGAIHGVDSIQKAIYDEVKAASGGSDISAREITGAEQHYEIIETSLVPILYSSTETTEHFNVPDGEMEFGSLIVQRGRTEDITLDLNTLGQANADNARVTAEGAAVFMGDGNDNITDGTGRDYVMMGDGDNTFRDRGGDADVIVGGKDFDTYQASLTGGPVMVTIGGAHSVVTSQVAVSEANNGGLVQDQLVAIEQIQGSNSADVFNVENVSGNMYIDGVDGGDKVYLGDRSGAYVIDMQDGQDPQGNTYSARVISDDGVLYLRNIDDADILRENAPTQEDWREDSAAQMEAEKRIDPPTVEKIDIPVAAGVLNENLPAFHEELTGLKTSGQMCRADRDMLDVLESSMPGALFQTLHDNGVVSLDITDLPMSTPRETVEGLMSCAADAFDPNTMEAPNLEMIAQQNRQSELEALEASKRDNDDQGYTREDDTVGAGL